ncbi:MAG: polynucleotide adenylyltransferase [Parcubacteria bacterium RAAC4_OD1_1]|nr:MAG: polynucleotide adenylyltransferase [Parcubacteria bacterium RAAC4_OD1_1]
MADKPIINNSKIPKYVTRVTETLEKAGFEAFLVGGCVRDLIIGREPKDWDITTNAKPKEIIPLFEKTIYENKFGTVGVCIPKEIPKPSLDISCETGDKAEYHIIEVTPYRIESKYDDFRHPNEVKFSKKIEDDLKRRDFTVNAIAYSISKGQLIDLYKGQEDIKDKVIRAVGDPKDRFTEDALRMLRAIRFSAELDFSVSYETINAIYENKNLIKNVSFERIRDEFTKIIMSSNSVSGIALLQKLELLKHIIPELEEGIGCIQGGAHKYDVWEHLLQALDHATKKNWSLEIRLSALFHDIGKPRSRRKGVKKAYTFYGHEVIGERMVKQIMERMRYSKEISEKVISFTRNHMFFSDTEKITLSAVRRIIQHVGKENIWDLMKVRECDRVGMAKAEAPYRLRKYHAMIEEALRDPISVSQLAIDGNYMMGELHVKPGPRMGWILNALLEEVLDDPTKNNKEHLSELVKSLDMLGDAELKTLGERGKEKKDKLEKEEIKRLHVKHGVSSGKGPERKTGA